jgi:hypothetical protein
MRNPLRRPSTALVCADVGGLAHKHATVKVESTERADSVKRTQH